MLAVVAVLGYLGSTGTPGSVERAAVLAAQRDAAPAALPRDEWDVSCDDTSRDRYDCTVVWRQVDRRYADGPADYCEERRVVVEGGQAGVVKRVKQPDGRDFRACR